MDTTYSQNQEPARLPVFGLAGESLGNARYQHQARQLAKIRYSEPVDVRREGADVGACWIVYRTYRGVVR